jgi:hypothetical protein
MSQPHTKPKPEPNENDAMMHIKMSWPSKIFKKN